MSRRLSFLLLALAAGHVATARPSVSGLGAKDFNRCWRVESEAADYRVSFRGDTCELLAPKGLTLWRKEPLGANMTVEYDACVVDEGLPGDRLSDMNCFWMASDPSAADIWARADWRQGVFTRCYSLQMYYLGYGGNHNTTTRFRRYDGDEAAVEDDSRRPAILREYTGAAHLLKANHWYHVKIESKLGRTRFFVDGECLVDYLDPHPLTSGWFGFRTTWSRTRITHFQAYATPLLSYQTAGVPLHWVGDTQGASALPVAFGVPFAQGELDDVAGLALVGDDDMVADFWTNARWPDGSVKWAGVAAVVPAGQTNLSVVRRPSRQPVRRGKTPMQSNGIDVADEAHYIMVHTGRLTASIPKSGGYLMDSLCLDGRKVGGPVRLVASTTAEGTFESFLRAASVERAGRVRAVVRLEGVHRNGQGREWLPFVVRLYFYAGCEQVRMVHTFVYDGDPAHDQIASLGIGIRVPLREAAYNRHVAFATGDGGVWAEPVQLLEPGRDASPLRNRQLRGERVAPDDLPEKSRPYLDEWAQWDGFRLSQLTDNAFSLRKRATRRSPWVGTLTGPRADGCAFVGDTQGGLCVALKDFWQSYPSTLEVADARSPEAELTVWLWSPEAEPMNLCHYDTVAHGLKASYEDVQQGLSTPYGIARTSELTLWPQSGYQGRAAVADAARLLAAPAHLLPTPEYLHEKRAFGVWSLPKSSTDSVEQRLRLYADYYLRAVEQHKWYGFWNYGDIMHAYDPERHAWRYDVGGFAWDNTELATPMWLWYSFLRTGRQDLWQMAEAMTRHCSEVDVYHIGPLAPLGSRHNVSHWGCGAKEARISQAAFNRFFYYLTTDERTGDLMTAQRDADTLLYRLDPMRLAEPRSQYPCSAPARLRVGPDWLAYAGNWLTEWERTGNTYYRDKIKTGMSSIAALPDGIFTGNQAKGYDPATGRISYDGDPSLRSTNHLVTIMGGFEVMNELLPVTRVEAFEQMWLDYARRYQQMALDIRHNTFPVRRLTAYAAWHDRDPQRIEAAWNALWGKADHGLQLADEPTRVLPPDVPAPIDELTGLSTNNASLWSLDAIYMQEVIGR